MSDFQIQKQKLPNGAILFKVIGFLDAHTYEQMEQAINQSFDDGVYNLIIDLSNLNYISSAGAGVFIGSIGTAQENDGNIILVNPTPNVREVLDLLGLTQIFSIANDISSAIKAL